MPNAPPYSVEIYWRTHIYIYIYNTYNILSSPSNKRKTFDIRQFWGKDLSKRIVFQDPYWVFVDFCCSPAVSPMFQPMVALAKSTQAPTSKKDPCVTKCGVVIGCKYRRHYGNIYIYIYIGYELLGSGSQLTCKNLSQDRDVWNISKPPRLWICKIPPTSVPSPRHQVVLRQWNLSIKILCIDFKRLDRFHGPPNCPSHPFKGAKY